MCDNLPPPGTYEKYRFIFSVNIYIYYITLLLIEDIVYVQILQKHSILVWMKDFKNVTDIHLL